MVKNLPVMQEMGVWFLGREDPLEEEMATHFSILLEKSHWQRRLVSYRSWGHRVGHDWVTKESQLLNTEAALQGSFGDTDGDGILTSNFIVRKLSPAQGPFNSY